MKNKSSNLHKYYNQKYSYETQKDRQHIITRIILYGRLKFAEKAKGSVLDIGCNDGLIASHIKGRVKSVVGIDISRRSVKIAKSRGVRAFICDAEDLSFFYGKKFDTVIMLETLEHLENPDRSLKEVKKVLKDGGELLLTVPFAFGFVVQLLEIKSKLQNKNAPIHKMYKKKEILNLLERNGFKIILSSYISLFNSIAVVATPRK